MQAVNKTSFSVTLSRSVWTRPEFVMASQTVSLHHHLSSLSPHLLLLSWMNSTVQVCYPLKEGIASSCINGKQVVKLENFMEEFKTPVLVCISEFRVLLIKFGLYIGN